MRLEYENTSSTGFFGELLCNRLQHVCAFGIDDDQLAFGVDETVTQRLLR